MNSQMCLIMWEKLIKINKSPNFKYLKNLMNIFELILHDPNHRGQMGLGNLQLNWTSFLQQIRSLQTGQQSDKLQIIQKGISLWNSVCVNTPNAIKMFREHYIYFLKDLIKRNLCVKLSGIIIQSTPLPQQIQQVISQIYNVFSAHSRYISIVDQNKAILSSFIQSIERVLENLKFQQIVYQVFQHSFRNHCLVIFREDIIDFEENIKDYVISICQNKNQSILDSTSFKIAFEKLSQMGILEKYFQKMYFMLVRDCQDFLTNCSDLQANAKFLSNTLNYHRVFQRAFIKNTKNQKTDQILTKYCDQIEENIYFLCAKYCSKNILEIVLDYPDSHGIILVLKKCLDKSNLLNQLSEQLYQGVKKRLLIPGVITQNILNQYLNMLKVLQIIDPHGIVFQKITVPIKNYLLKRNDTLRCIISHMTQNGEISTGLTRDMVRIPSKQYIDEESSDQNQKAAEQWQILNVKQNKMRIRVKYQEIDLATVLVNLYGSQQAFITEYQNMLAQKLMSAKTYNIEEEIKNIQLLKMRFGQNALQMCNVIVKDVKDSKKNDGVIHKQKTKNPSLELNLDQMNCLAVSKGYWPINYDNSTSFDLPQNIKKVFNEYSEAFSRIKAMRKIHYHNNLGNVNLTLTFKNGDFDFKCLPVHAVIINYFDEEKIKDSANGISSQQLSANLHLSPNVVKQKMSFWVHKGVIKQIRQAKVGLSLKRLNSIQEVQNVYYKPVDEYIAAPRDQMQDDVDEFISKQNTSMQSHLKHIIEGLVISILNINGPKSPQKIHLLLKTVYKTDLDYAYGEAQTIQILKKMVQKKKIIFNGQTYSSKIYK